MNSKKVNMSVSQTRRSQYSVTNTSQTKKSTMTKMQEALEKCSVQENLGGRGDVGSRVMRSSTTSSRRGSTTSTTSSSVLSASSRSSLSTGRTSRMSTSSSSSSRSSLTSSRSQEIKKSLPADVQKKIGNRQLKTINENQNNQNIKKCAACNKALVDDGFFAVGKLYHKSCFRCKFCSVKLGQIFFVRDEAPSCAKCHKERQEVCWVCKHKIVEDHISCNKKFYHPGCMKCYVCGEIIRERFLTFKDQPICEKDFKSVGHCCSVCEKIITGEVYVVNEDYFCEEHFEGLASSGSCAACGEDVGPDDALSVGDNLMFHHGCLECTVCKRNMEGKQITLDTNNRVYCTEDYDRRFCSVCAVCKKPIVPKKGETRVQKLRALGKEFHLHCFKCEDCSLVLKPGTKGKDCWPIKNHVLCKRCNEKRQDESEMESD